MHSFSKPASTNFSPAHPKILSPLREDTTPNDSVDEAIGMEEPEFSIDDVLSEGVNVAKADVSKRVSRSVCRGASGSCDASGCASSSCDASGCASSSCDASGCASCDVSHSGCSSPRLPRNRRRDRSVRFGDDILRIAPSFSDGAEFSGYLSEGDCPNGDLTEKMLDSAFLAVHENSIAASSTGSLLSDDGAPDLIDEERGIFPLGSPMLRGGWINYTPGPFSARPATVMELVDLMTTSSDHFALASCGSGRRTMYTEDCLGLRREMQPLMEAFRFEWPPILVEMPDMRPKLLHSFVVGYEPFGEKRLLPDGATYIQHRLPPGVEVNGLVVMHFPATDDYDALVISTMDGMNQLLSMPHYSIILIQRTMRASYEGTDDEEESPNSVTCNGNWYDGELKQLPDQRFLIRIVESNW